MFGLVLMLWHELKSLINLTMYMRLNNNRNEKNQRKLKSEISAVPWETEYLPEE